MNLETTITASEFKAKCLNIFDRLHQHKLDKVNITKRGRLVAVVTAPPEEDQTGPEPGFMRGTVISPADFDFTAPVLDEPLFADKGIIAID